MVTRMLFNIQKILDINKKIQNTNCWDSFHDYFHNVRWFEIFNLPVGNWPPPPRFPPGWKLASKILCQHRNTIWNQSSLWYTPACLAAIAHRNHFFRLYECVTVQITTFFISTWNKCVSSMSQSSHLLIEWDTIKLGSLDYLWLWKSVLNKNISLIPPIFNQCEVLSYTADKVKCFAYNFSSISTLDNHC